MINTPIRLFQIEEKKVRLWKRTDRLWGLWLLFLLLLLFVVVVVSLFRGSFLFSDKPGRAIVFLCFCFFTLN